MNTSITRGPIAIAVALVLAAALTGCRSGKSDAATGNTDTTTASFDVTIDQTFGSAHLTSVPTRVVALNQQTTDTVLAFGITPVGYIEDGGPYPWQSGLLDSKVNKGLGQTGDLNYEAIAALSPDLIVGGYTIVDDAAFKILNRIAPTIGPIEVDSSSADSWQTMTETVGRALGKDDEAQTLVDETNAAIHAVPTDVQGIEGKSYSFANFYQGDIYVPLHGDGASKLFKQIGLTLAPGLLSLDTHASRTQLSLEQLELLNGDIFMALGLGGEQQKITDDPRYDTLPAVKSGAVMWFDLETISGLNTPSTLSIPYCLKVIEPVLQKAVGAS